MGKRWGYIVALIIVIVFILGTYNSFNGNFISKYVAKKQLETYLEETYPDKEVVMDKSYFDFKWGGYTFVANVVGTEEKASFSVRPFFNKQIYDEYEYQLIDEEKTAELEREAEKVLTDYVKTKVPQVEYVSAYLKVNKGESIIFSKKEMVRQKPQIEIIIDSTIQSEEEFIKSVESVKKALDDGEFVYRYANVNGKKLDGAALKEGEVLFGTAFEPNSEKVEITYSEKINQKEMMGWSIQKFVLGSIIVIIGITAIYFLVRGGWRRK